MTVYDVAFSALKEAGLPVIDERIPFPGSGRQKDFEVAFSRALSKNPAVRSEPEGSTPARSMPLREVSSRDERVTLHEEISAILQAHGNKWMTTGEIAEEVNARGIYRKKDSSEVTAFQIHGRTKNYPHLFEREGSRVRLRLSEEG